MAPAATSLLNQKTVTDNFGKRTPYVASILAIGIFTLWDGGGGDYR